MEAGAARHRPVIVVGAGPVGLTAALALRARGLPATVLEADPEDRVRPGSRAIYIHGTTLRTLDRLCPGLGWALAERGLVWPTRRTCWRGREVFSRTYQRQSDGRLPHFTSLPQVEAERILLDACKQDDVEFAWGCALEQLAAADGVDLSTSDGASWSADYVIAADGARSVSRRAIGVEFEGSRSERSFVIADVAEDPEDPLPLARIFHYEHPGVGGRNVLLVPFAGGWRADLQCHDDDDPDVFSTGEGVRSWVAATLGERYADRVTWVSTYRFLQVLARSFADAHRRVLLVGEAAHLFAPFGARGMNSGVADADAAASAVATAVRARSAALARAEVDAFEGRRRAAAEWNRAAARQALAHMQARTPWERARRFAAVRLAPVSERAGEWLDTAPYGPRSGGPTLAGSKY